MRGHQFEIEILNLSPGNIESIQELFTQFRYIYLYLNMCKINKDNDQLVLSILSKLGPNYYVFFSSIYSIRLTLSSTWNIPTLDNFVASLLQEKYELNQMGFPRPAKVISLVINHGNKKMSK